MFFLMSFYLFLLNLNAWILSIMMFILNKKIIIEWMMMNFNSIKMNYIMYFDWMTMIFISTVMLISSLVILYSIDYMNSDIYIKRFMLMIIIFVTSMIFMIISPNMISILLGWDGLGLSSYCLVAYYQNKKSFNSSMITILMNRIGDIMILLTISLMMHFGSWNLILLNYMNFLILILLMMAAITKSAQIPFSSWLPLAMAAPTPISSLVHSSTLVTAGIYLMIRFNYLMTNNFMKFLLMLSCMTMFMAGSSAMMEYDFKKIIALSTLSQLGLMIMAISFNKSNLAFFHLITHAMFKSLLFLCSGIIIHNYFNHQDIRFISLINFNMPFINLTLNIASFTLCGMPFLTGFYSKDMIIENFLMNNQFNNIMILSMMFLSMSFTIIYSFRLMIFISLKPIKITMLNFYQSFNMMNYSIILLLIMSLMYGSMLNWILFSSLNMIFLPKIMKLMIFFFMILGLLLSLIQNKNYYWKFKMNKFIYFFNFMWFLSILLKKNKNNLMNLNNKLILYSDLSWMEYLSTKNKIFLFNKMNEFNLINKMKFIKLFLFMFIMMLILMFF